MKLTADVLLRAEQFLNPVRERELHLRGLKIPAIENLAVVQDQFDVIDFSDNEIRKLDNFPRMKRLTTLLLHNNCVARVGTMLAENVPGLRCLMLTNNRLTRLADLDNLIPLTRLEHLSLIDNPVALRTHYRTYAIHRFPALKTLDYRKVTVTERAEATKFFKSKEGQAFLAAVKDEATAAPSSSSGSSGSSSSSSSSGGGGAALVLTDAQKALVRAAIEAATTREDIEVIERHLKAGSLAFLGDAAAGSIGGSSGGGGLAEASEESKGGGTPAPAAAAAAASARVKLPAAPAAADGDADEDMDMA